MNAPHGVSAAVRRLNPNVYPAIRQFGISEAGPGERRLRQNHKGPNKLEMAALAVLKAQFPQVTFFEQSIRFGLANGVWYKPDICAWVRGELCAWEVKGPHAFRGGFENLKVAKATYPNVKFILLWKSGHEWKQQTILT